MEMASGTAVVTTFLTSFGTQALVLLTAILGLAGVLILIGYGWRKAKKHVTGRKI